MQLFVLLGAWPPEAGALPTALDFFFLAVLSQGVVFQAAAGAKGSC